MSSLHCQAGHYPGVASAAHCPQVRWFQTPVLSWPPQGRTRGGRAGSSLRSRELGLGLRPYRRRTGRPGPFSLGRNRRQYLTTTQHRTGAQAKPNDHMEGFHPPAYGRADWNRFLHGRGADLAGPGDILRSVLYRTGDSKGDSRRNHQTSGRVLDAAGGS